MPTNRKISAPAARPIVRFFLAEDFRQEIGGKVSAIGLYPDNVIVLQLPTDLPEPTPGAPILIRSLAFLFSVSALGEDSVASVDLNVNGDRKPFMAPLELPATDPGGSVNLLGVMAPCAVTSFGKRTVIVDIRGTEHKFEFEIRRVPSPASGGPLSPDTPSRAGPIRKRTRPAARPRK